MNVKLDEDLQQLQKNSLFYGLNIDELNQLKPFLQKAFVPPNTVILEEGEYTTDIYLIQQGEVNVLKWDKDQEHKIPILRIGPGEMFGEMSFVDSSPRGSSIESIKSTVIYKLSRQDLEINRQTLGDIYNKLLTNIARISIERLRITNKRISHSFSCSLGDLQKQLDAALAVLYFVTAMAFGKLLTFMNLPFFLGSQHMINWGFWVFLLAPAILLSIYFDLSRDQLGLSFKNLGKSLVDSLVLIVLGIGILYIIRKYLPINPVPGFSLNLNTLSQYGIFCILYEFLARGFVQSNLERVFKNSYWLPSCVTAVAFTLAMLTMTQLTWPVITVMIVGNILLGLLFQRNHELVGVTVAHFIIGLWIMMG
jgi:CRP-like cAMP-binding protein